MSAFRWPALVLVPALLVGGYLVDQWSRPDPVPPGVGAPVDTSTMAAVGSESVDSATWFCTAGASDAQLSAVRIRLVNTTDEARQVALSAYGTVGSGIDSAGPIDDVVSLEPGAVVEVDLESVVGDFPYFAAAVEVDGGGVLAEQLVDGEFGSDAQPCASRGSATWFLPIGTTVLGADHRLLLFNPFPEDAVVDLLAATENGVRESEFTGEVVPGGSVVAIDVGRTIQVAEELALAMRARSGRVVAGVALELDPAQQGQRGLSSMIGLSAASELSYLPNVSLGDQLVVYNPSGDDQAEVEVIVLTDGADDPVEPFQLTVLPNQEETLDLSDPARLGDAIRFTVVVQSFNDVAVVAARRQLVLADDDPVTDDLPELATVLAAPEAARRLVLDIATSPFDAEASRVTLANPSYVTIATVSVRVVGRDDDPVVVELEPGGRRSLPLVELGVDATSTLVLESSSPIVAQRDLVSPTLGTRSAALAAPVAGTVAELEPVIFE